MTTQQRAICKCSDASRHPVTEDKNPYIELTYSIIDIDLNIDTDHLIISYLHPLFESRIAQTSTITVLSRNYDW